MKYLCDIDNKIFDTAEACQAHEDKMRLDGKVDEQIGEYLDSLSITEKDENGKETARPLNKREFSRRETVIKDWVRWDREQRPERYQDLEEVDEAAVRVVTGAA